MKWRGSSRRETRYGSPATARLSVSRSTSRAKFFQIDLIQTSRCPPSPLRRPRRPSAKLLDRTSIEGLLVWLRPVPATTSLPLQRLLPQLPPPALKWSTDFHLDREQKILASLDYGLRPPVSAALLPPVVPPAQSCLCARPKPVHRQVLQGITGYQQPFLQVVVVVRAQILRGLSLVRGWENQATRWLLPSPHRGRTTRSITVAIHRAAAGSCHATISESAANPTSQPYNYLQRHPKDRRQGERGAKKFAVSILDGHHFGVLPPIDVPRIEF